MYMGFFACLGLTYPDHPRLLHGMFVKKLWKGDVVSCRKNTEIMEQPHIKKRKIVSFADNDITNNVPNNTTDNTLKEDISPSHVFTAIPVLKITKEKIKLKKNPPKNELVDAPDATEMIEVVNERTLESIDGIDIIADISKRPTKSRVSLAEYKRRRSTAEDQGEVYKWNESKKYSLHKPDDLMENQMPISVSNVDISSMVNYNISPVPDSVSLPISMLNASLVSQSRCTKTGSVAHTPLTTVAAQTPLLISSTDVKVAFSKKEIPDTDEPKQLPVKLPAAVDLLSQPNVVIPSQSFVVKQLSPVKSQCDDSYAKPIDATIVKPALCVDTVQSPVKCDIMCAEAPHSSINCLLSCKESMSMRKVSNDFSSNTSFPAEPSPPHVITSVFSLKPSKVKLPDTSPVTLPNCTDACTMSTIIDLPASLHVKKLPHDDFPTKSIPVTKISTPVTLSIDYNLVTKSLPPNDLPSLSSGKASQSYSESPSLYFSKPAPAITMMSPHPERPHMHTSIIPPQYRLQGWFPGASRSNFFHPPSFNAPLAGAASQVMRPNFATGSYSTFNQFKDVDEMLRLPRRSRRHSRSRSSSRSRSRSRSRSLSRSVSDRSDNSTKETIEIGEEFVKKMITHMMENAVDSSREKVNVGIQASFRTASKQSQAGHGFKLSSVPSQASYQKLSQAVQCNLEPSVRTKQVQTEFQCVSDNYTQTYVKMKNNSVQTKHSFHTREAIAMHIQTLEKLFSVSDCDDDIVELLDSSLQELSHELGLSLNVASSCDTDDMSLCSFDSNDIDRLSPVVSGASNISDGELLEDGTTSPKGHLSYSTYGYSTHSGKIDVILTTASTIERNLFKGNQSFSYSFPDRYNESHLLQSSFVPPIMPLSKTQCFQKRIPNKIPCTKSSITCGTKCSSTFYSTQSPSPEPAKNFSVTKSENLQQIVGSNESPVKGGIPSCIYQHLKQNKPSYPFKISDGLIEVQSKNVNCISSNNCEQPHVVITNDNVSTTSFCSSTISSHSEESCVLLPNTESFPDEPPTSTTDVVVKTLPSMVMNFVPMCIMPKSKAEKSDQINTANTFVKPSLTAAQLLATVKVREVDENEASNRPINQIDTKNIVERANIMKKNVTQEQIMLNFHNHIRKRNLSFRRFNTYPQTYQPSLQHTAFTYQSMPVLSQSLMSNHTLPAAFVSQSASQCLKSVSQRSHHQSQSSMSCEVQSKEVLVSSMSNCANSPFSNSVSQSSRSSGSVSPEVFRESRSIVPIPVTPVVSPISSSPLYSPDVSLTKACDSSFFSSLSPIKNVLTSTLDTKSLILTYNTTLKSETSITTPHDSLFISDNNISQNNGYELFSSSMEGVPSSDLEGNLSLSNVFSVGTTSVLNKGHYSLTDIGVEQPALLDLEREKYTAEKRPSLKCLSADRFSSEQKMIVLQSNMLSEQRDKFDSQISNLPVGYLANNINSFVLLPNDRLLTRSVPYDTLQRQQFDEACERCFNTDQNTKYAEKCPISNDLKTPNKHIDNQAVNEIFPNVFFPHNFCPYASTDESVPAVRANGITGIFEQPYDHVIVNQYSIFFLDEQFEMTNHSKKNEIMTISLSSFSHKDSDAGDKKYDTCDETVVDKVDLLFDQQVDIIAEEADTLNKQQVDIDCYEDDFIEADPSFDPFVNIEESDSTVDSLLHTNRSNVDAINTSISGQLDQIKCVLARRTSNRKRTFSEKYKGSWLFNRIQKKQQTSNNAKNKVLRSSPQKFPPGNMILFNISSTGTCECVNTATVANTAGFPIHNSLNLPVIVTHSTQQLTTVTSSISNCNSSALASTNSTSVINNQAQLNCPLSNEIYHNIAAPNINTSLLVSDSSKQVSMIAVSWFEQNL